jgi:hypothetical protein
LAEEAPVLSVLLVIEVPSEISGFVTLQVRVGAGEQLLPPIGIVQELGLAVRVPDIMVVVNCTSIP